MSKPIVSTEWASDGSALKVAPSVTQQNFGWPTSDNTVNGVPVKPNLQQQNGWQYAIHTWLDFIDLNTPDDLGEISLVDLWEWDAISYMGDNAFDGFNITDTVGVSGQNLQWSRVDHGQVGDADDWQDFQAETYYGQMNYELEDMIGRGIAVQLVDGDDVVWTVFNPNGTGLVESGARPGVLTGGLSSGSSSFRILRFAIVATSPNIAIAKDGVIVDDFLGFTTITTANMNSKNPNGFRAVLYGQQAFDVLASGHAGAKYPRKRWILPARNTQVTQEVGPLLYWRFKYDYGKRYRADFIFLSQTQADGNFNGTVLIKSAGQRVALFGQSSEGRSVQVSVEFSGEDNVSESSKRFQINLLAGLQFPGAGGSITAIYSGIQSSNIVIIEELE